MASQVARGRDGGTRVSFSKFVSAFFQYSNSLINDSYIGHRSSFVQATLQGVTAIEIHHIQTGDPVGAACLGGCDLVENRERDGHA